VSDLRIAKAWAEKIGSSDGSVFVSPRVQPLDVDQLESWTGAMRAVRG
jgi:hypothetical protein